MKRTYTAITLILMIVVGVWLYVFKSQRHSEEYWYRKYIVEEFLPMRLYKDGRWPTNLDKVEQDIQERIATGDYAENALEWTLWIHRNSHPQMETIHSDSDDIHFSLTFKWALGGTYVTSSNKKMLSLSPHETASSTIR